jgi:hypothetical protein
LAIAPVAISILGLFVSIFGSFYVRRQTIQALHKLNMDLHEKRYKIYSAAKRFIHFVSRDLKVSDEERRLILADTQEVDFLFDADMLEYIDDLRNVAMKLKSNMGRLERA